eukprot:4989820-Ditylum_brightwellii.AAC.1
MELKLRSWIQEEKRSTGAMLQQILSDNTIALIHVGDDNPRSCALAIRGKPVATSKLPSLIINTSDHPYFNEPPKPFQVSLPQKGCTLGLKISECDYYLLPFINKS